MYKDEEKKAVSGNVIERYKTPGRVPFSGPTPKVKGGLFWDVNRPRSKFSENPLRGYCLILEKKTTNQPRPHAISNSNILVINIQPS